MANAMFPTGLISVMSAGMNLDTDNMKASLIDGADYTYDVAHDSYADTPGGDVPAAAKVAASGNLAGTTVGVVAAGVFDSDNFTWTAVSGDVSEIIILWDDTHATDQLVAYYDTGITGMPVTPNTGDINVTVNASGWFSI